MNRRINHCIFFFQFMAWILSSGFSFLFLDGSSLINDHDQNNVFIEGVIAYVELDGNIYLMIGEDRTRIKITDDAGLIHYENPQFSPDGTRLAFLKTDMEKGEDRLDLFAMDLSTKSQVRLAEDVGSFDWSPDGKRIAFGYSFEVSCQDPSRSDAKGIWEIELATGETTEIIPANENAPKEMPVYSPDGQWIKYRDYICFSGSGYRTSIFNYSTGEIFMVGLIDGEWFTDQNFLLYSDDTQWGGGISGIYATSPDLEKNFTLYQDESLTAYQPIWSPHYDRIAVKLMTPQKYDEDFDESTAVREIALISKEGKKETILYSGLNSGLPVMWSPSGKQLLFTTWESGATRVDKWHLYDIPSNQVIDLDDFGVSGIDWIASITLSQTSEPTTVPPAQITEDVNSLVQAPPSDKTNSTSLPLLLLCGGGMLLAGFIITLVVILFVIKSKSQK